MVCTPMMCDPPIGRHTQTTVASPLPVATPQHGSAVVWVAASSFLDRSPFVAVWRLLIRLLRRPIYSTHQPDCDQPTCCWVGWSHCPGVVRALPELWCHTLPPEDTHMPYTSQSLGLPIHVRRPTNPGVGLQDRSVYLMGRLQTGLMIGPGWRGTSGHNHRQAGMGRATRPHGQRAMSHHHHHDSQHATRDTTAPLPPTTATATTAHHSTTTSTHTALPPSPAPPATHHHHHHTEATVTTHSPLCRSRVCAKEGSPLCQGGSKRENTGVSFCTTAPERQQQNKHMQGDSVQFLHCSCSVLPSWGCPSQ